MLLELLGAGVQLLVGEVGRGPNPGPAAVREDLVVAIHVRVGRVGAVAPEQAVVVVVAVVVAVDRLDALLRPAADLFRRDPVAAVAVERGVQPRLVRVAFEDREGQVEVKDAGRRQRHRRVGAPKRRDRQRQAGRSLTGLEQALALAPASAELQVPLREIGAHEPLQALDSGIGKDHGTRHVAASAGPGPRDGPDAASPRRLLPKENGGAFSSSVIPSR